MQVKHEFSKAVLARAVRIATQMGHESAATLIAGREPGPEEALLEAAYRGDVETIRKLLNGAPNIGDRTPDGSIYAGISPDTGEKLFAAAADVPGVMTFVEADCFAKTLRVRGYKDWRLPAKGELKLLFNNRAQIGGFKTRKPHFFSAPTHRYWSCTEHPSGPSHVYTVDFTNGGDGREYRNILELSTRMVRAEP